MILSRRVALGGIQLDELDERIVIRSVDPGIPHESMSAVNRMGGWGQRMTSQHWETLDVNVGFALDIPKAEMAERRQVLDRIAEWALKCGWMTAGHMPGRRVWIEKAILPSPGDLWEWLSEYTITFRAYGVPFWQDEEAAKAVKKTVTSGSVSIQVGGTTESVLDVSFKNVSGSTIKNFAVTAGDKTMTLNGLNLAKYETLEITHTNDGLLKAMAGTRNVYGLITGADDLTVKPGAVTVSVSASRAGDLTVTSYGRYL